MRINKLFILLSLSLTFLTGCSCSQKNEENTEQTNNNTPKTYERLEKSVGKSGGKVGDESNGIVLNIPEGALKEDTSISAQFTIEAGTFSEDPTMNFLCGVEFGPSGTIFDKPVDVSMHLDKKPINDELSIYCYDETNDIWDFASTGTISGENVTFQITHFSKYKCLDLKKSTFDQYVYIVRDAQRTGKSDSWITETYLDYLLNDIHIMDYYSDFMGHVYEPKGFLFNGMYQIGDKSHDPDATTYRHGESGYVSSYSSRCGYTIDASALSSYAEFLKEREKAAVENREIISISLTIYFKMVKPIIDLTAQKTELKKGESTTVDVHCHYKKPENFFPENRDIDLAFYKLTLPLEQTHLMTNMKEFYTNNDGKALFRVTSLDGESETVKVMFYVEGVFGEYSDAYIEFKGKDDENHKLTGTVKNIVEYEYNYVRNSSEGSRGKIKIVLEYKIEGTISWSSESTVKGIISYSDISLTIESTPSSGIVSYQPYIDPKVTINSVPTTKFSGIVSSFLSSSSLDDYTGYEDVIEIASAITSGYYETASGGDSFGCDVTCYLKAPLLDNFEFRTGTQTCTVDWNKDGIIEHINRYSDSGKYEVNDINSYNEINQTIQTLTIS